MFYSGTVSANSVLDNVTVEYGGGNGSGNIYFEYTSPVTIKNSIIQKNFYLKSPILKLIL